LKSRHRWEVALEKRRAKRELFFSTAFESLRLVVAVVLVATFSFCTAAYLIHGDRPDWRVLLCSTISAACLHPERRIRLSHPYSQAMKRSQEEEDT
jgi:hypothetical protein